MEHEPCPISTRWQDVWRATRLLNLFFCSLPFDSIAISVCCLLSVVEIRHGSVLRSRLQICRNVAKIRPHEHIRRRKENIWHGSICCRPAETSISRLFLIRSVDSSQIVITLHTHTANRGRRKIFGSQDSNFEFIRRSCRLEFVSLRLVV